MKDSLYLAWRYLRHHRAKTVLLVLSLSVFLAYRVVLPTDQDPELLTNSARWPVLVLGGIWGATLSSALGSILGAPRTLQALAFDGIVPSVLGRGRDEPRIARPRADEGKKMKKGGGDA